MTTPTLVRDEQEVVGAYVPITLAGQDYKLAELPRQANRQFQWHVSKEIRTRVETIGPLESVDQVMDAIAEAADLWLDLLIAYDQMGAKAWAEVHRTEPKFVLPDRDWLDARATDGECYRAIKKVTAEAYPLGADLLALVPELKGHLLTSVTKGVAAATVAIVASSASMSSAPPSTDGSPTTSSAA